MSMKRIHPIFLPVLLTPAAADAGPWQGLVDASDALATDTYGFKGTFPEQIQSNENYYDGDFADFDGDGVPDRALGSRYGLLFNRGGGLMTPYAGYTGFLLRGMPGASGWGDDAFQWADVDGDGDLDNLCGGNGEPLTLQTNRGGRFSTAWQMAHSALNIVSTDIEGDGDVDLVVAHAFCNVGSCGGPVGFALLVNDGTGTFTEESAARGLNYPSGDNVVGAVSGDVDGDGDLDLLIAHGANDTVELARNDGTGNFTVVATPLSPTCSGFGQGMNLGDVDDDGDLDLVLTRCREQSVVAGTTHRIGINDGTGTFSDETATRFDAAGANETLTGANAKLVDIDHDGDLDWVAGRTEGGSYTDHQLQIWLNDGSGAFTFDAATSMVFPAAGAALGYDVDISDLDGDGSYDVWFGIGGDRVRILLNTYESDDGLPADQPRNVTIDQTTSDTVVLAWDPPPFASPQRHYRIYRSTLAGAERRDRRLLAVVGDPHQDEGNFSPITRHTTAAMLDDPNVQIDAATGRLQFTDDTVQPGVTYLYSVTHVGAEHVESAPSDEVAAAVPGGAEDGTGPTIDIVSPTDQDWWAYPRVVAHLSDGGSGVNPDSLEISFDADLGDPNNGGRAAGTDLSDLAYRLDGGGVILPLAPPLALPDAMLVTMTVRVEDMAGNATTATRTFFVSPTAAQLPTADFTASATAGTAPLTVDFDASASDDPDGKLLRWEWYFGDGTTATGRIVDHTFKTGGVFDVMLLVRDNDGGVAITSTTIDVRGPTPECTPGQVQTCYDGPAGTEDVGVCAGGSQTCDGGLWGPCNGQTTPSAEVCDNDLDDDCDGLLDGIDDDCGGPGTTSGGTGASTGSGTGGTGTAGTDTDTAGASGGDDGAGCGCRTDHTPMPAPLALPVLLLAIRRRRA